MLSWGHLTTAVYRAHAAAPDNEQVRATLRAGLTGVTVFNSRTPDDVLEWLCTLHNSFHHGSGVSYLETMKLVQKLEQDWAVHRQVHSITARS
eukprot:7672764-Alexandrium_andersonii.AAC.1